MHTKDGGQSWQTQHEDQAAVITKVSFINEQEGWMVGNEIEGRPYRLKNLLFHTLDGGEHWLDASGELNRLTENEKGYRSSLEDIRVEGPRRATVLFLGGEIFKTDNVGFSWRQVTDLPSDIGKHYFKLGTREDDGLWIMGGNYGARGIFGTLTFERSKNSWTESSLNAAYFKDAVILENQQALACGFIPVVEGRKMTAAPPEQKYGTIFYSLDGGHNWSMIYHNKKIRSINALGAINSDHIWAAGEDGINTSTRTLHRSTIGCGHQMITAEDWEYE